MNASEVKDTCDKIIAMYKFDPEEGHIWEDTFLQRFLRTLARQVQTLSCDAPQVKELQSTLGECMQHIEALLHAERTKWFS